jgi:hypothetical protein
MSSFSPLAPLANMFPSLGGTSSSSAAAGSVKSAAQLVMIAASLYVTYLVLAALFPALFPTTHPAGCNCANCRKDMYQGPQGAHLPRTAQFTGFTSPGSVISFGLLFLILVIVARGAGWASVQARSRVNASFGNPLSGF